MHDKHLPTALIRAQSRIDHFNAGKAAAHTRLANILRYKNVVLVNNSFNVVVGLLEEGIVKLRKSGFAELADLYVRELFHGDVPTSTHEMFSFYLGQDINLRIINPTTEPDATLDDADLVLYSGSSANVTYGLTKPNENISMEAMQVAPDITHGEVLKNSLKLYEEAVSKNIPTVGFCYGHQLIGHRNGGEVINSDLHSKLGLEYVTLEEAGGSLLENILGMSGFPEQTSVASYHYEATQLNPKRSLVFARATKREVPIEHIALQVADDEFTNDEQENERALQNILNDGKHIALTFQGHPEYSPIGPFVLYAFRDDASDFYSDHETLMTTESLELIAHFLEKHKRFQ